MTDLDKIFSVKPTNLKPAQGKLLISEPFSKDFFFKRSVVLLAEHNEEGSFGIIMNKSIEFKLNDVISDFPEFDAKIFIGGPVKTDSIFFIHKLGYLFEDSMKIMDGLYWGGNIETIKEMIIANTLSKDDIRFFIGYSGWEPGQLEKELNRDSWIIADTNSSQIMHKSPTSLWKEIIKGLGDDYQILMNLPADALMN